LKDFGSSVSSWMLLGTLVVFPLVGCGGTGEKAPPAQDGQAASQPSSDQTASRPLSDQAQLLVNQGNTAQREGRYAEALAFFGQASDIHPNHAVPQFGGLLAAMAVGDTALAQSFREKLEVSGPELLAMLGPGGTMGGMTSSEPELGSSGEAALPPGHPVFTDVAVDSVLPDTGSAR